MVHGVSSESPETPKRIARRPFALGNDTHGPAERAETHRLRYRISPVQTIIHLEHAATFVHRASRSIIRTHHRSRQLAGIQSVGTLSRNPAKVRNHHLSSPQRSHQQTKFASQRPRVGHASLQHQQHGSAPTHPARRRCKPTDSNRNHSACHSVLPASMSVSRVRDTLHERIIKADFSLQSAAHNSRVNNQRQSWSQIRKL